MDHKFPSLLMESWSPQEGVSPDFVVCGGSPHMDFEADVNLFSFDGKGNDDQGVDGCVCPMEAEAKIEGDCLFKEESQQGQGGCTAELQGDCETVELKDKVDSGFSFSCKGRGGDDQGLTEAMFPEVHSPLSVDGWSDIPLKTPAKEEKMEEEEDANEEEEEEPHFHTPLRENCVAESEDEGQALHNVVLASNDCKLEDSGFQTDVCVDTERVDDLTLCKSQIRLIRGHQDVLLSNDDAILCINAGEEQPGIDFRQDKYFVGGDVIRTGEKFVGDGKSSLYQTARFGNFSYIIGDLPSGDYYVDLHFAEVVFTNGPPGMRVFDVFIQEEKILSEIDIFAHVGANTPLVLMDVLASVIDGGNLTIRFEAIVGSPIVSAICIRKPSPTDARIKRHSDKFGEDLRQMNQGHEEDCNNKCRGRNCKAVLEYKKKLEELNRDYELKKKECHEAWISLDDSNRQLERARNELMRKSMHVGSLAYAVEGQVNAIKEIEDKHENEKKLWVVSLQQLTAKVKVLKSEHSRLSKEANSCASSLPDIYGITSAVQVLLDHQKELKVQCAELKTKFLEECKERKQLYNKLLELKGNIRVFCRCRPLSPEEVATGAVSVAEFDAAKDCELSIRVNGAPKKVYKFDSVFSPQEDQVDVFRDTAPVVVSVLDGYNVCIFAYGQTGTGKTFTMEGTEENRGVNYRTLEELFRITNERKRQFKYDISVSVLEVYNEQIRDLLASPLQPGQTMKKLEIKQVAEGVHHVPGLVEAQVHTMSEVWEVLKTGSSARAVGATNANEHSSRSHCILCVMVKAVNLINGECTRSKLWLVDLAGSERVAKTDVQGERLKEAQNINKSLSSLGDVISALANKSGHIPFRNSKLTHLLQDSLGGDSKTLMFVQISPNEYDISETLCSLNFASRVRGVELGPAKKQLDPTELLKFKQMIEKVKQEGKSKDVSIKKMEEIVQNLESKVKGRDQANKSLQDKVKELEAQLANERKSRFILEGKLKENHQQQAEKVVEKPPVVRFRTMNEPSALSRDLVNLADPLTENKQRHNALECNGKPHDAEILPKNGIIDPYSKEQKENNLDVCDQINKRVSRRTGRASLCTTAQRPALVPSARRVTMVPLPLTRNEGVLNFASSRINEDEEANGHCTMQPVASQEPVMLPSSTQPSSTPVSLRGLRTSQTLNKLRRSIHRKVQLNSPLLRGQSNDPNTADRAKLPPLDNNRLRRISTARNWGRISGTSNIAAQRVLCSNKAGPKATTQLKEKERGWNR